MKDQKLILTWQNGFENAGIKPELIQSYIFYISKLVEKNVPIIFDFSHLCLLLGRKPNDVLHLKK